jgi:hypothetical protein
VTAVDLNRHVVDVTGYLDGQLGHLLLAIA